MNNNGRKKIKVIIAIVIAIMIVLFGGSYLYINSKLSKVQKVEINKDNLSLDSNEEADRERNEVKNIALYGIDEPQGTIGRSDAVMVLTIDKKHDKLRLTSIMRDSYVDIPGHGRDKLTHAYAFGGPELAMKTLNQNFKLNIQDFMAVNFTSMPEIINKIGGVEINITKEEISHIPGITKVGLQNLNGAEALAYSRIRHASGGDYQRTERQRVVLEAIFNKIQNTPKSKYPELIDDFLPYVKTNMSTVDVLSLATDAMPLMNSKLQTARFPLNGECEGKMIKGVWYLVFNENTILNQIQNYIYDDKALPSHSNDNT